VNGLVKNQRIKSITSAIQRLSERICRMNRRTEDEMEEPIITKQNGKWRLIKKSRRDFSAANK